MPATRDIAIKTKLRRLVALTTVLAWAIACSAIILYQYRNYRQTVVTQSLTLAEIMAANSSAALVFHDGDAAREMLRGFAVNPELLAARIYTHDGLVFAEYVRPGAVVPPLPSTPAPADARHVFEGNQLIVRYPIKAGGNLIGQVALRSDMRTELRQLRISIGLVVGCMLVAAGIALILADRLQRKILGPILDLAAVAGQVAATRDYSLRAADSSRDEVGALTRTFNDMLGQIQQRDQEVSEAYEALAKTTSRLEVSEERFRQLAENIREVFWMTDITKTEMLYISPTYETIWGRSCESLRAEPLTWLDAVHPDDRERVLAALPAQVEGRYDIEFRIRNLDNAERWIHDRAFPIRDASGKVYRLAGIAEDVTARKHSEQALHNVNTMLEERVRERTAELAAANAALVESEARLRLALDASQAGVWSWDPATNTSQWDDQYHAMYGFEPHEPRRHEAWLNRVHPADRVRLAEQIQALLQPHGGEVWNEDFRVLHPTTGERWMTGLGRVERDATGQVVRITGINLDITRRKQIEEEIRHLNEVLEHRVQERTAQLEAVNAALITQQQEQQTILDSVPSFIWYKDRHNRILRLNHSAAAALGKTVAEVEGRPTEEFYPDAAGKYYADDQEVLRTGQPKLGIVEQVTDGTGNKRWVQTDKVPFRDQRGEIIGLVVCATDITQLRHTELALRESEARLEQTIHAGNVGLWDWDLTTNKVFFSVLWKSQIGYADHEISNDFSEWEKRVHPDDLASTLQKVRALIAQPFVGYRVEFRFRHKDGSYRWILAQAAVLCDAAGKPQRMLGTHVDVTEQKQADERLHAAELKYRLLVEQVPAVTYTCELGVTGRWHYISPQIETLLGFTSAEWQADPRLWYQQVVPADRARALLHDEQARQTGRYDADYRLLTRDGQTVWVHDVGVLIQSADGGPPLMQGILYDITSQKLAEAAMAESQERYRQLVEQAPDAIGVAIHGKIAFVNTPGLALLGATQLAQLLGKQFTDFVHPADRSVMLARVRALYQTQVAPPLAEYTLVRLDGATIQVEVTATLITYQGVPALQAVIRDVTARHQAAAALRASQEQLQAIMDNTFAVIYVKGADGKYLLINRRYETLFHVTRTEIVGQTDFNLFPRTIAAAVRANDQQVLQDEKPQQFEELIPQDDGMHTYVSVKFPLRDATGAVYAVCGISLDITERQQLQQQILEISDREQGRIGRDLHDGLCQVLTSTAFAGKALEGRLAEADPEAADVAEIIELVLQANDQARKIARGLYPVELQMAGLAAALRELATNFSRLQRLECRVVCDTEIKVSDTTQSVHIYRIVQEALTNALKHGQARAVTIRLAQADGTLAVSVADNGVGVKADALERPGMGLSIMNYRAQRIGGTLRVHGGSQGGTIVELVCPISQSEEKS